MDYITAVLKGTKSPPRHRPAAGVEGRISAGHQQQTQMLSACWQRLLLADTGVLTATSRSQSRSCCLKATPRPLPRALNSVLPPRSAIPGVTFCRAPQPAATEPPLRFWFSWLGCTLKSRLPQWRNVQGEQLAQGLPDSTSGEKMQPKAMKLNVSGTSL